MYIMNEVEWWTNRDSNPGPSACKADALPTELLALTLRWQKYNILIFSVNRCVHLSDFLHFVQKLSTGSFLFEMFSS